MFSIPTKKLRTRGAGASWKTQEQVSYRVASGVTTHQGPVRGGKLITPQIVSLVL